MRLKELNISEINHKKIYGRTTENQQPLTLFWTGSGIEFNFKGTELWLEIEAGYIMYEPWFSVSVNGAQVTRQMAYKGKNWICLLRNMSGDVAKKVVLTREVQAMSGDPECFLQIHSVKYQGEFLPVPDNKYKFEFIGDSITSGEGLVGAVQDQDWISMFFGTENNYAIKTAKALDADYHLISQSGWGVLSSWDNNPNCNIPQYYDKVCGLLYGPLHEKSGAFLPYDFSKWQPDVIVVNLGTNDASAFEQPIWEDGVTGETFVQRKNPDGSYHQDDLKRLKDKITDFLKILRENNPKAYILWANGMLGTPIYSYIQEAIDKYTEHSGDKKVKLIKLPEMTEETVGSRCHPGVKNHQQAADTLICEIKKILP